MPGGISSTTFFPSSVRTRSRVPKHRLGKVDRHLADDVEPVPVEEAVGLHLEGDDQIAGGSPGRAGLTLAPEPDLGAGLGAGRHRDQHLAARCAPRPRRRRSDTVSTGSFPARGTAGRAG